MLVWYKNHESFKGYNIAKSIQCYALGVFCLYINKFILGGITMNHFDVQRAESLMRYAEFLNNYGFKEYRNDVINLLHSEIAGINETKYQLDKESQEDIKQFLVEKMKKFIPDVYDLEEVECRANGETYCKWNEIKLHPKLERLIKQLIKETVKAGND